MAEPKKIRMFDWHAAYFKAECPELAHTRGTMATLAAFANFDTMRCFPSQATLAKLTGQSVETVRRHIKLNIGAGWLKQVSRGTSHKQASVYEFVISEPPDPASTPLADEGSSEATPLTHEGSTPLTSDRPTTNASTNSGEVHPAKETTHQDSPHDGQSGDGLDRPSDEAGSSGRPMAGSGSACADREVVDVPLAPGGHLVGSDQDSAFISWTNEFEWTEADEAAYRAAVNDDDRPGPDLPESKGWLADAPEEPGLVDLGPW